MIRGRCYRRHTHASERHAVFGVSSACPAVLSMYRFSLAHLIRVRSQCLDKLEQDLKHERSLVTRVALRLRPHFLPTSKLPACPARSTYSISRFDQGHPPVTISGASRECFFSSKRSATGDQQRLGPRCDDPRVNLHDFLSLSFSVCFASGLRDSSSAALISSSPPPSRSSPRVYPSSNASASLDLKCAEAAARGHKPPICMTRTLVK